MVSDERLTAEKEFYTSNTTGPNSVKRKDLFKQYYEQQATVDKRIYRRGGKYTGGLGKL